MTKCIAFVDVGFLRGAINSRSAAPQAAAIEAWAHDLAVEAGSRILRTYWYDGAYAPEQDGYEAQQAYLDAVRFTSGVYVRLGHIQERPNKQRDTIEAAIERAATDLGYDAARMLEAFRQRWEWRPVREQKGVDTLMALDLVRLAQRRTFDVAIVVTGDRDLVEAVRTVQDEGVFVLLASPFNKNAGTAKELRQVADRRVEINDETLRRLVTSGSKSPSQPSRSHRSAAG